MRIALIALTAAPLVAAFAALPASAQQPAAAPGARTTGPEDVRVNQLVIYGGDACPQSQDPNEVTVCARLPEDDRFRVPPNLRNDPNAPANQSWAGRAIELSYAGRTGTGSCSTSGPGGFTGCFNQMVTQARAERRSNDDINWARLIEEARQERLSRIDQEARDAEAAAQAEEANRPN
jgi:hypothetical protein